MDKFFEYFKNCEKIAEPYDEVLVMGDIHGVIPDKLYYGLKEYTDAEKDIAVILLGDVGANYYNGKRDRLLKKNLNSLGVQFYLLRGNHEMRPEAVITMGRKFDCRTEQYVMYEKEYPNIYYLIDGNSYHFNGLDCLAIGGAYSVDKYYRQMRGWHWFADEQLNQKEMNEIDNAHKGEYYDFILTHTCPYNWRPTDLFIKGLDQSTVDNTMEHWLEKLKDEVHWDKWLFGHFHETREVIPHKAMMLSNDILLNLEDYFDSKLKR